MNQGNFGGYFGIAKPNMANTDESSFRDAVTAAQDGTAPLSSISATLLSKLSPDERLSLLDGDEPYWGGFHRLLTQGYNRTPYVHGSVARLGIPGVRFSDGPRGCVMGESTAFPVPMARGATWDAALEERVGLAIGRECRAQGANYFGGVCVNLPRHPAWGRIQETYGEDPILLGEFGAALTRGVQRNAMACVKHYALNSMENARFQVDVEIEKNVLHEVYLAHFRRIIDEGVASVMSSYNSARGEFAGQNKELLTDILRGEYGFQGFVLSDFLFGLRDAPLSLKNGLDIEAPFSNQRKLYLRGALEKGEIGQGDVDRACTNILSKEIENAARRDAEEPSMSVVFCDEHRALARETSVKSMVLLKNNNGTGEKPLLPLEATSLAKVAVIGRLADSINTGDRGSSLVRCPTVVSPYQGLREALPEAQVVLDDSNNPKNAAEAAAESEVAVVIVGYDWTDEGEYTMPPFKTNPDLKKVIPPVDDDDDDDKVQQVKNIMFSDVDDGGSRSSDDPKYGIGAGGDRISLRLSSTDVDVIKAAVAANPRTVVCVIAAGAVIMEEWDALPPAILLCWYSGCEGGRALADVLLGRENVGGRLPFSIPRDEKHLPFFDKNATKITYDQWFGQRLLDKLGVDAAYPLGYGLSYTTFSLANLQVSSSAAAPETLEVSVTASNTGARGGRFVAQVYGATTTTKSEPERPSRVLLGFAVADIGAGERRDVRIGASTRPLQRWDEGSWELASKEVVVEVGGYSGDEASLKMKFRFE